MKIGTPAICDHRSVVWLAALFVAVLSLRAELAHADHPNVLLIYGDDVGYGDVGAYGAKLIPTPNIDRLARQSLQFTDGHCSASTCTPSRFSLLTGIHGFRHNIRVLAPDAPITIKPSMLTLPALFRRAGYQTAIIGKWHLGLGDGTTRVNWNADVRPGPLEVGFDYCFLLPSTNDRVPCVYLENHRVVNLDRSDPLFVGKGRPDAECTVYPDGKTNRAAMTYYPSSHGHNQSVINGIGRIGYQWGGKSALWNDETMADEFVQRTKAYLQRRDKSRPFFLFYSAHNIHVPRAPNPRFHGKSKLTYRGDSMVEFDWSVGQILKTLDELQLRDNTIVIFTSDNGPVYDDGYEDGTTVLTSTREVDRGHDASGPYRGGKYQIYEGGTRVPFLIRWPGRIAPGRSSATVNQIDFIASFAELLGVSLKPHEAIDSRNTLAAFLGQDATGLPHMVEESPRRIALRRGPWKYVAPRRKTKRSKGSRGELYRLSDDIGEQKNVIAEHPDVARDMKTLLDRIRNTPTGIRGLQGNE